MDVTPLQSNIMDWTSTITRCLHIGGFRNWCQHWCILAYSDTFYHQQAGSSSSMELSWWQHWCVLAYSPSRGGGSDFIETHPSSSIPEKSGKPGLHRWLQDPSLLFDPRGVRKALPPQVPSGPGASTGAFWNFPGGSTGAF